MAPAPKSKQKARPQPPEDPTRVVSGKALRERFIAVKQSPDGGVKSKKDGQGGAGNLLQAECVECEHCRLPVYPAKAKVANDATFERLEIKMGAADKEAAKKAAEEKAEQRRLESEEEARKLLEAEEDEENEDFIASMEQFLDPTGSSKDKVKAEKEEIAEEEEEEEDEDEEDEDLDTVEALERANEKLQDKVDKFELQVEELEDNNERLQTELDDTKEKLRAANERIEFLEESEAMWRDKYRAAMDENGKLKHEIDQKVMKTMDAEGYLMRLKEENTELFSRIQIRRRRRDELLLKTVDFLRQRDHTDVMGLCIRLWRFRANFTRTRTVNADRERSVREDVYGRAWQVEFARADIARLEKEKAEHIACRLKSGQGILAKVYSVGPPWNMALPMKAWKAILPQLTVENLYEKLQKDYEQLKNENRAQVMKIGKLEKEIAAQIERYKSAGAKIEELEYALENKDEHTRKEKMSLLREADKRLEAAVRATKDEAELRFQTAMDGFNEERAKLDDKVDELQTAIDTLTFGGAAGKRGARRVCPRGKGVLCIGCMRQLVHRDVSALPPKDAVTQANPKAYIDDLKETFFDSTFQAGLDPQDKLMVAEWRKKIDPLNVSQPLLHNAGIGALRPITREVGHDNRPSTQHLTALARAAGEALQHHRPQSRCESLPALAKAVQALGLNDQPKTKVSRPKEILDLKSPRDKSWGRAAWR